MSRVASAPISVPSGVEVKVNDGNMITVKGPKGTLQQELHRYVDLQQENNIIQVTTRTPSTEARMHAGTIRSLVQNMVTGVSAGFEKKLELVGVGYRAAAKGKVLNLTLGFSHPIDFPVPDGITIETPTQTEILVKGSDKQQVGQVAAIIREFRPPEPYKGKGVKYANEQIARKEAKKK